MLRWRLLLGPLFVAALAAFCWLDFHAARPGVWLAPFSLLVCLLASGEILWLLGSVGLHPRSALVYAGNFAIVAISWVPLLFRRWPHEEPLGALGWPLAAFTVALLAALTVEVFAYRQAGGITARLGATVLALGYVGVLFSFLVQLRSLGGGPAGIVALVALVSVVKLGDIGAYTVGRLFGRHKLAPHLSPGKTIEGALGGLVLACFGAWFALVWLAPQVITTSQPAGWGWVAFGLIVGAAGILGDLAESLLKRDVGRKDSSNWLPGFGGVLDIVDSLLFAAPIAYLCWIAGLGSG